MSDSTRFDRADAGADGQSRLRKWPGQRQRGWRELGFSGKGATLPAGSLESPVTLTRDPTVPNPVDMSWPHLSDVPLGRSLLYLLSGLSFPGSATLSSVSRTSKCWAAPKVRTPTSPHLTSLGDLSHFTVFKTISTVMPPV